jgi:AmmeMemoRadiSam system protein B
MVSALDEALFLDSDRFTSARQEQVDSYLALDNRPAHLAGGAYPKDPDELNAYLEALYDHEGGPGGPPAPASGETAETSGLGGLVVPHIDFERGGPAYAHAYRALAEQAGGAKLFVVFGTSHSGCDGLFGLTRKGYETPLGLVPCDTALVDDIVRRSDGQSWFAGDYAHRQEHSIEFQAVWLRKLWPEAEHPDLRIVPILCGSFHDWIENGGAPTDSDRVEAMIEAVTGALAARGEPAVIIAGADLAHIGPRFGDPEPPTDPELERLAESDHRSLQRCLEGDADGFFRDVAADGDARRICGLSPIYMTLRTSGAKAGTLLQYGQAEDPTGPSTVSFASLTLTR